MRKLTFTLLLLGVLSGVACKGQVEEGHIDRIEEWHGSAYIQCVGGPFYLNLDLLKELSIVGKSTKENAIIAMRIPGEVMVHEVVVDSVGSDIVVEGASGDFIAANYALLDSLILGEAEYPSLASASFIVKDMKYRFWLENAYQGGCRHDRLKWIITEL